MQISDNQTLSQWLHHHASNTPDALALDGAGGPLSYKALSDEVGRLASGLARLGIGPGDTVGVQLPNTRDFVICFLAVTARGGIFQTLHMPYRSSELRTLLADSGAKAVIVTHGASDSRAEDVMQVAQDLPALAHVITLGRTLDGCAAYEDLATTSAQARDMHASTAADHYLLLYTSGTTAGPKGVPHVYANFLNNARSAAREMQIGADARVMSLAPMSHLYGLFTLHMALAAGATQVLVPAFHPDRVVSDIETNKPSHIYAAPAHFAGAVATDALDAGALDNVQLLCLSGSAVPPALAKAVDDKMPKGTVVQLWGMSELQAGCYGRPDDPVHTRTGSCGRAAPHTELRVLDDSATPLPPGQEGALQVRGPSLFGGYLNRPQETSASFVAGGWFATGDLAVIDADGFVRITGRTKELINRGGVKYNPIEVEDIAMGLAQVTNCAVVPVPDATLGERGCLCVCLGPNTKLTLAQVTEALNAAGIAKFKWPERLEILADLPMTPTRKVIRSALRAAIINREEK
ncbi:class I adenylate-forming enzyme family protein [Sulfitobacter sp. F26204]|uniref:class I adenylate-forming enzyme family protein n=1 Tax=Sulfitobacter sp. F26204 TaxID=2996014 RepID=UPI00225E2B0A|nr:class I adenylate-forming enzyme family protein [Sulfitobacter sp. F26204]MCX7561446.1 class I adenylate-forming enzyme family protein [Sulfitobacter sp. F26204]